MSMPKLTYRDIIEFLALPLLTAAVYILWDMNKSIDQLNIQVGVMISEGQGIKEDVRDLQTRVRDLELKR